jgi:hypothetical protein
MPDGSTPAATFRGLSGEDEELQVFTDRIVLGDLTVFLDRVGGVAVRSGPGPSLDPCDLVISLLDREPLVIPMALWDAWEAQDLIKRPATRGDQSHRTALGKEPAQAGDKTAPPDQTEAGAKSTPTEPAGTGEAFPWTSREAPPHDAGPSQPPKWEDVWASPPPQAPSAQPEAGPDVDIEPFSERFEELWQSTIERNRGTQPQAPADVEQPAAAPSGKSVGQTRTEMIPPERALAPQLPRTMPVKKEAARRRIRSRTRLAVVIGAFVALAAIGAIAYAYRQAYDISRGVRQSVLLLESARSAVSRGEVPTNQVLDSVEAAASEAQQRVKDAGFTFRVVGRLPFVGRPVNAVRLAADAADQEAQAARIMRGVLVGLFGRNVTVTGGRTGSSPVYRKGRVNLGLVTAIEPQLSALLLHLQAADSDIRSIQSVPFASFVSDLRARALAQSGTLIQLTQHAIAGTRLLPSFFGAGGAQTYLLVLQDFAALNATGGTVVAYGTLTLTDGVMTLSDVDDGQAGPLAGRLVVATSKSISFEDQARSWNLAFRQATGHRIDGVIGIDPFAIAALLQGQPPIRLPPYPGGISSRNLVSVIEEGLYQLPPRQQHDLAVAILAEAIRLLKDPPDLVRMLHQISGAAANLHVELWVVSPRQQGLIEQIGWNGG